MIERQINGKRTVTPSAVGNYRQTMSPFWGKGEEPMRKIFSIVFCVALLVGTAVASSDAQTRADIRVKGADSMYSRIMSLSIPYMKDHPDVDIDVEKNGLVDDGIRALFNGEADVAMASRRITASESETAKKKGVSLSERLIGYGGIVIITHPSTTVGELTMNQVRGLLSGEFANWKEVGAKDQPVKVFKTVGRHPGTLAFVESSILGGAPVARSAVVVSTFFTAIRRVAETPGGIAFTRIRDPYEWTAKIKVLKIRKDKTAPAVSPSREAVLDGSYPIRRPYFLYTSSRANDAVQAFADYVVSKGWGPPDLTYVW